MPDDVTDAELAVLQALWESPGATIRELTKRLYPPGNSSQYATVQKLLERLENKGFAIRDRRASKHTFWAKIDRDQLIGRRLSELSNQLCEGSLAPLLSNLVSNRRLSQHERDELRALVVRLDEQAKE